MISKIVQESHIGQIKSNKKISHPTLTKPFQKKNNEKQRDMQKKSVKNRMRRSDTKKESIQILSRREYFKSPCQAHEKGRKSSIHENQHQKINHHANQHLLEVSHKSTEWPNKIKKFQINRLKGAINFEGKFVKNSFTHRNRDANKKYWSLQSVNRSDQPFPRVKNPYEVKKRSKKCEGKKKSAGHVEKNNNFGNRQNGTIQQQKEREKKRKQILSTKYSSYEQFTKSSRVAFANFQKTNYEQTEQFKKQVIDEQNHTIKVNYLTKMNNEIRVECIVMMSLLCAELEYSKEVFGLAVNLFDSYTNDQIVISKHKILALACLMISIKIDEAETVAYFVKYLLAYKGNKNKYEGQKGAIVSGGSTKSLVKSKSSKKCSMSADRKRMNKLMNIHLVKNEKKWVKIDKRMRILPHVLQKVIQEKINRKQLFQMELMVLIKEEYRVHKKSHIYWIDNLTVIWDHFLLSQKMDINGRLQTVLFRVSEYLQNFAYLTQIVEICLLKTTFYNFPMVKIVLATIYLIVRIKMQGEKDGMQEYRKKLEKSSNFLFADKTGINLIFGDYLNKLGINMSDILPCCQFVGANLHHEILIKYPYQKINEFESTLSLHFHNDRLASKL